MLPWLNGMLYLEKDTTLVLDVFRRFREQADRAAEGEIQVEFLVAFAYGTQEKVQSQVQRIVALYGNSLIDGAALAGDGSTYTVRSLQKQMDQLSWKYLRLAVTMIYVLVGRER
jgi:hypothetical protein